MTEINTRISPVYLLRRYAWAVMKNNLGYSVNDYGGKNPIIPLSEEPEFVGQYDPYVIYGYSLNPQGPLEQIRKGTIAFVVYSDNFSKLTQVLTEFENAFGRYDKSARDINEFTSRYSPPNSNGQNPFIGIRFNYTNVTFVEGGSPEEAEGGRMSAMISIGFSYSVDYNGKYGVAGQLDSEGDPILTKFDS